MPGSPLHREDKENGEEIPVMENTELKILPEHREIHGITWF